MPQQSPKNLGTLKGLSITLFALTSITFLTFVMVVIRFNLLQHADIAVLVVCTGLVSICGFISFLQTVKQISALADGISNMQAGKIDAMHQPVHRQELSEVIQIRKALVSMMSELKTTPTDLPEEGSFVRDK